MPSDPRAEPRNPRCPACTGRAFEVEPITVRGLVHKELASEVSGTPYIYCPSASCQVVYAAPESDSRSFVRDDIRVRIGEKEAEPPITVCYCFDWTVEDIEREVTATGDTSISNRIREKVQNGLCHCETMNPRGICCLGTVNRAVEDARARASGSEIPVAAGLKVKSERSVGVVTSGAVVASVLASACCWLPLLLVAFGVSSIGLSAFFGRLRPVLVPITLMLLGTAWILTYREPLRRFWRRSRRSDPGTDSPETAHGSSSCCAVSDLRSSRRFVMKRLRHVPLWAGTAAVLAFLSFPQWSPLVLAAPPEAATKPSAAETRTVLPIEGMTCGGCAANVETALSKVPGVSKASVNYEKAEAVVMAAPSVTRETLARAVEQAGYRVAGSESGSTSKATAALSETSSLPILKGSLKPVIEDFNENKDKPRVLALLSPT